MLHRETRPGSASRSHTRDVQDVRRGTHAFLSYTGAPELRSAVARYIAAGLEHGERCIYVLGDRSLIELVDALDEGGVDVPQHAADGSLQIVRASHVYAGDSAFDAHTTIERLRVQIRRALDEGYVGLRAAAEMGWAVTTRTPMAALADYEREAARTLFIEGRFTGLCMYDSRTFGRAALDELERAHGSVLRPASSSRAA